MPEFYGTVQGFMDYVMSRGYEVVADSPTEPIEAALIRGSVYIDGRYRHQFDGKRTEGRDQSREWPRTNATDYEGNELPVDQVPIEVEQATYEATWRELTTPGSLLPDYVATERVVAESVGALSVKYAEPTTMRASDSWPVIGIIDRILEPLLGARQSALFGEVTTL